MLFLANMAKKMNNKSALGSRIAEVHNGSSLFTGDAGQGESNIRRWLIESDYVEAIIALPLNLFYNTGIATYVWVLTNKKPAYRQGKVQLIDASQWFKPLRKNLGKKNCELSPEDIERISRTFLDFREARVQDLRQRSLWLLEGHRRAPAAAAQPDHAQGDRVPALHLRRRRHPWRALRGVRRRALHGLRQGGREGRGATQRLGQR
jgi:type I restriction-modification system DNA methylase subunit